MTHPFSELAEASKASWSADAHTLYAAASAAFSAEIPPRAGWFITDDTADGGVVVTDGVESFTIDQATGPEVMIGVRGSVSRAITERAGQPEQLEQLAADLGAIDRTRLGAADAAAIDRAVGVITSLRGE